MKIAIVRVRGPVRLSPDVRKAFELLGLKKSNSCIVVEDSPHIKNTLEKLKDYVTWGVVNDDVLAKLTEKKVKVIGLNPNPAASYVWFQQEVGYYSYKLYR